MLSCLQAVEVRAPQLACWRPILGMRLVGKHTLLFQV